MTHRTGRCCGIEIELPEYVQHLLSFHDFVEITTCCFCGQFTGIIDDVVLHFMDVHSNEIGAEQGQNFDMQEDVSMLTPSPVDVPGPSRPNPTSPSSQLFVDASDYWAEEEENTAAIGDPFNVPPLSGLDDDYETSDANGNEYQEDSTDSEDFDADAERIETQSYWFGRYNISSNELDYDMGQFIEHELESIYGTGRVRVARHLLLYEQRTWDRSFGCGYRNLQTLTHAIRQDPEIAQTCGIEQTPRIIEIQRDIESAWNAGFDPGGNRETIVGSTLWIGPDEAATYLGYHNALAHVIDVSTWDESTLTNNPQNIIEFIFNYFFIVQNPFPIILQYSGHSCSVIGCAVKRGQKYPLVYDPLVNVRNMLDVLRDNGAEKVDEILRKSAEKCFANTHLQLVVVRRAVANIEEYERNKQLEIGFNRFALSTTQPINHIYFFNFN